MPAEIQMGGVDDDRIFLDTDFTRKFHVKNIDLELGGATDGSVAKDITGKTLKIDIRKLSQDGNIIGNNLLTGTNGDLTITGTFNADATVNTQRAVWTVADTHLTMAIFGAQGGTFAYSVKITNDTEEAILQYGTIVIQRATQAA